MKKNISILLVSLFFTYNNVKAQFNKDSIQTNKEFNSLDEALKNPESVYRLNLSNQELKVPDTIWLNFTNLEFLSLKNDHLKNLPNGIGYLKNLKVLDLSGNDFKVLPPSYSNLVNLQELFINDDKYFKFERNVGLLSKLPKLRSLHIENDGLKSLPKNIFLLNNIESIYLNKNEFKKFPIELNKLKNLHYLDLHDNRFRLPAEDFKNRNVGLKVRF